MKSRARAVLAAACSIHFVHDGFSDILYVLLPIWANEFRLTFAQVGIIRTAYSGGMAAFQIPAGLLAERWGERRLLAAGTAVTACGFIAAGTVGGFVSLLAVLLIAGLGSGVQHPLSSSLVSKAYETGPRRAALGTYNFSGDLGKVAVPAAVAFAALGVGWRTASAAYGVSRTVVLTEAATALGILALLPSPLPVALALLPLIGVALNGTSSVLYGTVADLVSADRRSRAYGLYYTVTIMSSALAPSVYGLIGDLAGVSTTLVVVSALVLTTIPLCLVLRASVAEPART